MCSWCTWIIRTSQVACSRNGRHEGVSFHVVSKRRCQSCARSVACGKAVGIENDIIRWLRVGGAQGSSVWMVAWTRRSDMAPAGRASSSDHASASHTRPSHWPGACAVKVAGACVTAYTTGYPRSHPQSAIPQSRACGASLRRSTLRCERWAAFWRRASAACALAGASSTCAARAGSTNTGGCCRSVSSACICTRKTYRAGSKSTSIIGRGCCVSFATYLLEPRDPREALAP